VSDQPNRLEIAFSRSIERRRRAAGPIGSRDDLYHFVNRLRGDGIPVEASAAVLDFDPMDFRRWLADDTVVRFRSDRARNTSAQAAPLDRARRPASNRSGRQPAPSDQMRRAFEGPVRTRAAELMPEPPDDDEGWFPLVRLLAGEGVPVDVSTAILGVDVDAYRFWTTDDRRQISSSVGDSGRPA
jgi:hypothetical protein